MPLKFACPHCKSIMAVSVDQAGKEVVCSKCQNKFRLPTAKSPKSSSSGAASQAAKSQAAKSPAAKTASNQASVSSGLANALSELTESDFNRQSPFASVYAPPKPQASNHELIRRVADQDARQTKSSKAGGSGKPVVLVLYAVHNLLQAGVFFVMVGFLAFAMNLLSEFEQQIPMLSAGITTGMVVFGILGAITLVTAIGLLTKHVWGYVLATGAYSFFCILHLANLIAQRGDRNAAVGAAITLVIALFLTTYFFRSGCRKFYRLKGWVLPAAAAGGGALGGAIFAGVLSVMGIF